MYIPFMISSLRRDHILEQLKRRYIIIDDHWLYTGALSKKGYGQIQVHIKNICNRPIKVHRLIAYVFHDLDLFDNKQLACHIIDCKYKNCFNPEHVYKGDSFTNNNDMVKANTHKESRKTHCSRGHEYNQLNTDYRSNGTRRCKACRKVTG